MKVGIVALVCVAGVALSAGPTSDTRPFRSPKANVAKTEYDRAVAKAKADYDKAVKAAGEKYAGVLQVCQLEATQANDLDNAVKYKEAKEKAFAVADLAQSMNTLDGAWVVTYSNGLSRIIMVSGNRAALVPVVPTEIIVARVNSDAKGEYRVTSNDGKIDVIVIRDGNLSGRLYTTAADQSTGRVHSSAKGVPVFGSKR